MGSFYKKPNGAVRKVKNLGWLLRYARKNIIEKIIARQENGVCHEAILEVYFKDGTFYQSDFADYRVLCVWLRERRVLRGVTVFYFVSGQFSSKREL